MAVVVIRNDEVIGVAEDLDSGLDNVVMDCDTILVDTDTLTAYHYDHLTNELKYQEDLKEL